MNTYRAFSLLTLVLLLTATIAYTEDAYSAIYLGELQRSAQPQYLGNQLLFTYTQQPTPPRTVAVAFAHQQYTQLHYMQKNEYDVFLLTLPLSTLDSDLTELQYLYIVDGIWIDDPANPQAGNDFAGKRYSQVSLPDSGRPTISPRQRAGRTLFTFAPQIRDTPRLLDITGSVYYADSRQTLAVFLAGSFNGWDPTTHQLQRIETPTGASYRISLNVPRGEHRYYFVVNGVPLLDPLNETVVVEPNGRRTSFFTVD